MDRGCAPYIVDEAAEIDFSASCVIDTASEPGSYADLFRFPPWIERIPHSLTDSSEKEHDHGI